MVPMIEAGTPGSAKFGVIEDRDPPRGRISGVLTGGLYDWWISACRGSVPAWADFDVTGHARLVPNLFLVAAKGGSFEMRLYGEAAKEIVGWNPVGHILGHHGGHPMDNYLIQYYRRVLDSRRPWRCHGMLEFADRGNRRFESLDVPLQRWGSEPDLILGVIEIF